MSVSVSALSDARRERMPGLRLAARATAAASVGEALPLRRDHRHDLGADGRRQLRDRHANTLRRRVVDHAERDDDRDAGLDHLVGEVEVPRERRCVGDDDDGVGGAGDAAQDCVDRDLLVA